MDAATIGVLAPLIGAAISALFWQLVKEKDRQIAKLEADNAALESKVEKMSDVLGKNTDALAQSATAQEAVVAMLRDLLGETSTTSSGTPRG